MKFRHPSVSALRPILLMSVAALAFSAFPAIETNVSTVAELVGALEYINSLGTGNKANTIVLAPAVYDVSECAMTCRYDTETPVDKNTHLALRYVTLRGATGNPRDVVIFGGGEAKKRGVILGYFSAVRDLTISNGWANAASGGGYCGFYNPEANGIMRELVSNCVVTCCYADGAWCGGGGVNAVEILDSELCFNRTGGSSCYGAANRSVLRNCFVHSNSSASKGGGLGTCLAYDCVISNNTAATGGGGMAVQSHPYLLSHCRVVDNSATSGSGAVNMVTPSAGSSATNTLFAGNRGTQGAVFGAFCRKCVISNNCATTAASANNVYGAGTHSSSFVDCDICFNCITERSTAKGESCGAGAYNSSLTECRVFGNAILEGGANRQGAGAFACAVTNSLIYENYAVGSSQGVGMYKGTAVGCLFSNNQANVTWSSCQVQRPTGPIVNCEFFSQAIECTNDSLVANCRFWGVRADGWRIPAGHNVASPDADLSNSEPVTPYLCQGNALMRNCLFVANSNNHVSKANDMGSLTFENCTFADNRLKGTFLNFNGKSPSLNAVHAVNCILVRNFNESGTSRADLVLGGGVNAYFRNCLIGTARTPASLENETGTVTADDARFTTDSATDPYGIKRTSPAIGRGAVLDWMTGTTDIRAQAEYPRLRDGKVDIGCYQCWLSAPGMILLFR